MWGYAVMSVTCAPQNLILLSSQSPPSLIIWHDVLRPLLSRMRRGPVGYWFNYCACTSRYAPRLLLSGVPSLICLASTGVGAAFTIPSAQAHIGIHFSDPAEKSVALGWWAAAGSVGFVVGLILGGVLTATIGWRWIFYISLICSGVAIVAAFFILPHREVTKAIAAQPQGEDAERLPAPVTVAFPRLTFKAVIKRFDVPGVLTGVPGIILFTYALTAGGSVGWASGQIIGLLVASVVFLVIFGFIESRSPEPLMPPRLWKGENFTPTIFLAAGTYAIRQAVTYFLTLQLQGTAFHPIDYGHLI